jgi:hypothetical protein
LPVSPELRCDNVGQRDQSRFVVGIDASLVGP